MVAKSKIVLLSCSVLRELCPPDKCLTCMNLSPAKGACSSIDFTEGVSIGHPHLLETILKPSEKYVFYREPVKSEKHPNLNLETMLSFSLRPIMASWLGRSLRPRYIWTELVLSRQSVQFALLCGRTPSSQRTSPAEIYH